MNTRTLMIRAITRNLSDGSEVTDIVFTQDNAVMLLHACSADDASDLVTKLVNAVRAHTVENIEVV